MSRAATVFLLLAAVAAVVFVVIFVPLDKGGGKPVGAPLFDFDPDDISRIQITNGDGVVELRRTEDGWMIGPEPKDRASVEAVRRVIETAQRTPIFDRIDAGEIGDRDKLSIYGLKKSRVQFDFKGDRDLPLLVGKDAADEGRVYVRFENSRDIYLVPDDLFTVILSSPQDFRDRMPVRLRPDRVDRIVIKRPAGEIELKREARGWQIVKPLSARADDAAVEGLLGKLVRTRIEGFEKDADPGAMGFSEPSAEVQLFGEGDRVPESIQLGADASSETVYARLEPRGVTVRLPSALREMLGMDLTTLRDTSLARINLDLVDMIRVTTPGTNFTLRRKGEEGWVIGEKRASTAAVQRMVDALALLKSAAFEPATVEVLKKTGLDHPAFSVEFFSVVSENTPEAAAGEQLVTGLKFGQKQENGLLPVLDSGSPEVNFVPDKILEAIPPGESAWLAP